MRRQTWRDIAYVTCSKVIGGLLTLGLSVLLLRLLQPQDYGLYSLCLAGILLVDALIGSPIDLSVLRLGPSYRAAAPSACDALERAALQLKVTLGLGTLATLLLFGKTISRLIFHDEQQWPLVLTTGLAVLALVFLRSILVHCQLEKRFDLYSYVELLHNTVKFGGIAALFALADVRPSGVLAFFVLGPLVAFAVGAWLYRRHPIWSPRLEAEQIVAVMRHVKVYALTAAVGNVVNRLDVFLLTIYGTLDAVGLFSGAQVFAMVPPLLASYLAIVLSPRIIPYYEAGLIADFQQRLQRMLLLIAVAMFVGVWVTLQTFRALFPVKFQASAEILLILLPGALVSFATVPAALPFVMFLRPGYLLGMECAAIPVLTVVYYFAIQSNGIFGASVVSSASAVIRGGLVQVIAWKLARSGPARVVELEPTGCGQR